MPKPRDEEDDLFHDEDDLDFVDEEDDEPFGGEAAPAKSTSKPKKTAKKTAKKKVAKKTAKKKTANSKKAETKKKKTKKKKKAKKPVEVEEVDEETLDTEDESTAADTDSAPESDPASAEETPAEQGEDDDTDEYGRPKPTADYVVHVYELGRYKRTIDRDFIPEEAEAYATEFSRTAKQYGRKAIAGKKDTTPAKELQ